MTRVVNGRERSRERSADHGGDRVPRLGWSLPQYTRSMTAPTSARPGRNEPCHCGSGRKYKYCCLEKDAAQASAARAEAAAQETAEAPEAAAAAPARAPKPETHQPWKATTSRGFIPRMRTPRKVGGS